MKTFDVVVVGTGAGGLAAASELKKSGLNIALIGNDRPGGDCSYYGCVPTKTLIHSAKVLHYIRHAKDYGLPEVDIQPVFRQIMAHKDQIVNKITSNGSWQPWEDQGFSVFRGTGRLLSQNEVKVNDETIRGEKIILAVGTEPLVPPIDGLREAGYVTNVEAVSLRALPSRLLIVGAGPIGIEFAQLFVRLGSKVTVLEAAAQILSKEDEEIVTLLKQILEGEGMQIYTGAQLGKVERKGKAKMATVAYGNRTSRIEVDEILVAIGRKAPLEHLGLEKAGVKTKGGWITVDKTLRTSAPNIWALGDCTGKFLFTHIAEYQARLVANNLLAKDNHTMQADYGVVPWVTFTDPELARVGLTEQEAKDKGIEIRVAKLNFSEVERAVIMTEPKGMIKVLVNKNDHILGATVLGPHADDLIHEYALAMKAKIKARRILSMIHAYPTLSESVPWSMRGFKG